MKNKGMLIAVGFILTVLSLNVSAREDRYVMCKRLAKLETGYRGPAPTVHVKKLNLLKGAAKGALAGAVIGRLGRNSANNAAKKGAALGGLAELIKHKKAKKRAKRQNARNRQLRDAYNIELNACMGG